MPEGIEAFYDGARMARELADREENPRERDRHTERADWYEAHASMLITLHELTHRKEAAE